ncbi:uncharacterized protein LOC108036288 [Drosophila biarmipes]|uniref:uncharacterized protein LOC108036288 n=1 Tax=Drosophila biarmipes TaxID=125945 RepID=UPI001CDA6888|nr:uncharacterized protein LOC108036288 [Drosophila biarmipes]
MKSNQVFFIALSFMVMVAFVPLEVESFKVDLENLADCLEVGIAAATTLASRAIPCLKKTAACAKFRPLKTKDLDATGLALLGYQYMQKVLNSQRCLLLSLKDAYDALSPHINKIINMKCVPFSN